MIVHQLLIRDRLLYHPTTRPKEIVIAAILRLRLKRRPSFSPTVARPVIHTG
jgi:hypothetical protein